MEKTKLKKSDKGNDTNKNKKITTGKDIFGTMKFSKSTEELMREVDKELYSDFF